MIDEDFNEPEDTEDPDKGGVLDDWSSDIDDQIENDHNQDDDQDD